MRFTEEQLRQAAMRVQEKQMAQLPPEEECQDVLSPAYQKRMQELIAQVKRGEVKLEPLRMGWQYYARRGTAAVLLCFLLACLSMPEVVMAGCQKLIEVVETIFEEYTEFRFTSDVAADTQFVPLTFHYLPDGLIEAEREEDSKEMFIAYADQTGRIVLDLQQDLLEENAVSTYIVDTEDTQTELVQLKGSEVRLIYKGKRIQFLWIYDSYMITGQTVLSQEEIMTILQQASFSE